jgi:hypothetical protein
METQRARGDPIVTAPLSTQGAAIRKYRTNHFNNANHENPSMADKGTVVNSARLRNSDTSRRAACLQKRLFTQSIV